MGRASGRGGAVAVGQAADAKGGRDEKSRDTWGKNEPIEMWEERNGTETRRGPVGAGAREADRASARRPPAHAHRGLALSSDTQGGDNP